MEKQLPVMLLVVGLVIGGIIGYGVAPKGEDSQGGFTLLGVDKGRVQELEQEVTELNALIDRARERFSGEVTTLSGEIRCRVVVSNFHSAKRKYRKFSLVAGGDKGLVRRRTLLMRANNSRGLKGFAR